LAAVTDIQGSVKANDQKASAALVVHGLLFAGILTVVSKLGSTYENATTWQQIAGLVALAIGLAAFLVSVAYLLRAIRPYRPERLEDKLEGRFKRVFFPLENDLKTKDPLGDWRARVDALDFDDILDELTAEVLKLAEVLRFESSRARIGYRWLLAELVAVAAFFVIAAGVAISQI
jgi:hypothetical protein